MPASRSFDICVIGHLRPVKDSFRAALAARILPACSRIRVVHVGGAMTERMKGRARCEMEINARYRWLDELPRARALRVLSESRVCVISSRMEGGANVLSEAIVAKVPVLASRIDGNTGILGENYPGLFGVGDTHHLMQLMLRAETDRKFLRHLQQYITKLAPLFDPERERRAWARLLADLRPSRQLPKLKTKQSN